MKNYILLWVCLWCAGQLCAETAVSKSLDINIVGHVLDKNTREHLPYISVVLKGTTIGVMTDASGHYFLKNLQETQTQLDNASLSMNKYAAGAKNRFDALGFSVTQIARELPALAFGPQMFFLAISNNIGPFQDALSSARKEYQMLMEAGKSAIPVWKQLLKSVFSLQTGLSVATTLLVVYGDKITEWISTLFRASAAVDKTATNVRNLSRVMDEAAKQSAAERVELDILYKATQDQTRSLKERNAAADELQRKYPESFSNLTNEAILVGDAANAYQNLTENILKVAQARAAMKIV